ncbi:MAG TPA: S8 family serine peptidase, partial [Micromonosporaceae bacterium]
MSTRKFGAVVSTAALIASLFAGVSPSLAAQGTPTLAAPGAIGSGGTMSFAPGRYIVTLADPAAATYDGGIAGLPATRPGKGKQLDANRAAVKAYSSFLKNKQMKVADSVGAPVVSSYSLALNGFATTLTAKQAAALAANKAVASLAPDELRHVTAESSTHFLGLEGPQGVWASLGGTAHAGEGVVVGMLDTGIAPENPSFAGAPLAKTPGTAPYLKGKTITFKKADGNTFTGTCTTGVQFSVLDCNSKLIGARYFVSGFGAKNIGGVNLGEYRSPRDGDGHGSHTSSTAAGNANVAAAVGGVKFGAITGVAPAAKIAAYKVCWTGPDPTVTSDDGCATSDIIAAIDSAVADGVDVINFSIGGGAAQTTYSPTDQAFLGAAAAGVFVSASAGNDGPTASTLDNASPWITTVAAGTIPSYEATATLGNKAAYAGASITVNMTPGATPLTGSLMTASAVAVTGAANANLCAPGSLSSSATGKIIVCERGVYDRVAKSAEVKRAGGIGMILINVIPGSMDLDLHSVPTIHIDAASHDAIMSYAATTGATVTFRPGNSTGIEPAVPQVAGFSSRGPVEADGSDILKPDITAPGVAILADGANAAGAKPTFQFLSGTSMAAPHITGLAALYLGKTPNATPAQIKSAMMTTAYNTVDVGGKQVTDPFTQGAGHVDPTKFFSPGLLYLNDQDDWDSYIEGIGYELGDSVDPIDPSNLNLASIAIGQLTATETVTRTVTSTTAGTFKASISIPGISAKVSPSTLKFTKAGESKSFTVTVSRTTAPLDQFATGFLTWTSGKTVVRSPLAVKPVTIVAPAEVTGTGATGSVDITVTPGGTGDIALSTTGLSKALVRSGTGSTGAEAQYPVTVPTGAQFARFDLDAADDTTDLDLIVYRLENGVPVEGWQSASGSA